MNRAQEFNPYRHFARTTLHKFSHKYIVKPVSPIYRFVAPSSRLARFDFRNRFSLVVVPLRPEPFPTFIPARSEKIGGKRARRIHAAGASDLKTLLSRCELLKL